MTIFEDWPQQWYGWWRGESETFIKVPLFSEVVDPDWNPPDLQQLATYLNSGKLGTFTPSGKATRCGLCEHTFSNNSIQLSDGDWVWPQCLGHYVEFHHVRLPDRFVQHIRAREYVI